MRRVKKILFNLAIVSGILLGLINNFYFLNTLFSNRFAVYLSFILFIVLLISYLGYTNSESEFNKRIKRTFRIALYGFFIVNIYLGAISYDIIMDDIILSKYHNLKSCDEAHVQFEKDKRNGVIRYFGFNIFAFNNEAIMEIERKFGVVYYNMGCLAETGMDCYNKEVEKYMKKEFHQTISQFLANN